MRSKRRKQKGVGEWMVAQMVIPVFIRPFTTLITCAADIPMLTVLAAVT